MRAINPEEINVYIDESGNLGLLRGRLFTINAVEIDKKFSKSLHNKMKSATLKIKSNRPDVVVSNGEVKFVHCTWEERQQVVNKIHTKEFYVHDINADVTKIIPRLLKNQSILYNYLLGFLVKNIVLPNKNLQAVHFVLDERNTSVKSGYAIDQYLKQFIWTDLNRPEIDIEISTVLSHKNYGIQVADFMSGLTQCHCRCVQFPHNEFESLIDVDPTFALIQDKIQTIEHFPYKTFCI
ncbi:DUF3800 domain-containing protein [Oenococcus sicerae]|uniref:DUF3800 domain-containing protein n=1 Tax=Oenococcus sicerae TaxID=2203724 RepID=A0AAJ1RAL9_9LACO|nr:DUF3800 domain-containing protein [Oenococcus sicerae]MDN6900812.1 hypothetical protein [Oenococcus sicerae]